MNSPVALEVHKHCFLFSSSQKQKPSIKADWKVCQFFCQNLSMLVKGVSQSRVLKPQSIPIRCWIGEDSGNFWSWDIVARSTFAGHLGFWILFLCFAFCHQQSDEAFLPPALSNTLFYQVLRAKRKWTELSEMGSTDPPSVQLSVRGIFPSDIMVTKILSYPLCKNVCTAMMPKFQEGRKKEDQHTNKCPWSLIKKKLLLVYINCEK